jgi:protein-disulfide isomerase
MRAIADDLDFYAMMETRGYTRAQADACLSDEKKVRALAAQSSADADKFKINSTPSFVVNGKTLDIHTWDELQKVLSPS